MTEQTNLADVDPGSAQTGHIEFGSAEFGSVEFAVHESPDRVQELTVFSWALNRRADISMFAPLEADLEADLPLVILLHGVYGSHWAWARSGLAHQTAQALTTAGTIRPMVLAMPSDSLFGIGSGYLPRPSEDAERWIMDEVQAAVRLRYPTAGAGGVAVAGLSMGGWGALRLAALHPGRFRAAVGMSPLTKLEHVAGYATQRHRAEHAPTAEDPDLLALLTRQADRLPPLRVTCGTEDSLLPQVRELHRGLGEANVAHEYHEDRGAHEWAVWEAELERSLRFIDANL